MTEEPMGDDHGNGICLILGFFFGFMTCLVIVWATNHVTFH